MRSHKLVILLVLLLTVRLAASWCAYDRIPWVSGSEDFPYNDAALAWLDGQGFRSPAYEGTDTLEIVYSQFPPLFPYMQAGVFRCFGLSPLTLRLLPILCGNVSLILAIGLLVELYKSGLIHRFGLLAVGFLMATDVISFVAPRWGRSESIGLTFALGAFTLTAYFFRTRAALGLRHFLLPALLMGAALSTHWTFFLYGFMFALTLAAIWLAGRTSLGAALLAALIPGAVFVALWCGTFGRQSWRAVEIFQITARSQATAGRGWADAANAMLRLSPRQFLVAGGLTVILVYLAWMSIPLCLALGRRREHETPANGRSWLCLLLLLAIVQIVMVQFVYGVRITRVYPIFPAAMVGLAASFSFLSPRGRRCLAPVVGAIVVLQAALVAGYLHLGYREWQDRDPERFAPVVAEIVAHGDAKVACVPQFWYAFHRRAMFPTILDFGVLFDRDAWMRHPDRIQRYDAVCLPANHEFLSVMDASRYQRRSVESCGERYYIFEARPSDSPRAR